MSKARRRDEGSEPGSPYASSEPSGVADRSRSFSPKLPSGGAARSWRARPRLSRSVQVSTTLPSFHDGECILRCLVGGGPAVGCGCASSARRGRGPVCESERNILLRSAHISARDRSTVERELALRPGHSPKPGCHQRRDLRHEARSIGLLVLTAGLVSYFLGVIPPTRWTRRNVIERAGALALTRAAEPAVPHQGVKDVDC
jgi:hypothetical protein